MEKFSSVERMVGNMTEEEKEEAFAALAEVFNDQKFEGLSGKEREKTEEELHIVEIANRLTNELAEQYGGEAFEVPPGNIHIVKQEHWSEEEPGSAFFAMSRQAVAMRDPESKLSILAMTIHEMLHFKSYNAMQKHPTDKRIIEYRNGLVVQSRDGKIKRFTNLNEAITETLNIRLMDLSKEDKAIFISEVEQTKRIMAQVPGARSYQDEPLFTSDTYFAKAEEAEPTNALHTLGIKLGFSDPNIRITTESFIRKPERRIFNILVQKIRERNSDRFKSKQEVAEIFYGAYFTGNILPIGRLIDGTFGKGTFRQIGDLDDNIKEQRTFIENL